jgi:hypothetical protein
MKTKWNENNTKEVGKRWEKLELKDKKGEKEKRAVVLIDSSWLVLSKASPCRFSLKRWGLLYPLSGLNFAGLLAQAVHLHLMRLDLVLLSSIVRSSCGHRAVIVLFLWTIVAHPFPAGHLAPM